MSEIRNYQEFWPAFVSLHSSKWNRKLHFTGTGLAFVCLYLGVAASPWLLLGVPVFFLVPALAGHFFFERSLELVLRHPLRSLRAELQMFAFMCAGRMDREVRRMQVLHQG